MTENLKKLAEVEKEAKERAAKNAEGELSDDELRMASGGTGAIPNNRCSKCGCAIIPGSGYYCPSCKQLVSMEQYQELIQGTGDDGERKTSTV